MLRAGRADACESGSLFFSRKPRESKKESSETVETSRGAQERAGGASASVNQAGGWAKARRGGWCAARLARVVLDGEGVRLHALLGELVALAVRLLQLGEVRGVRAVGEEALLREQRQHAALLVLDEVHHLRRRRRRRARRRSNAADGVQARRRGGRASEGAVEWKRSNVAKEGGRRKGRRADACVLSSYLMSVTSMPSFLYSAITLSKTASCGASSRASQQHGHAADASADGGGRWGEARHRRMEHGAAGRERLSGRRAHRASALRHAREGWARIVKSQREVESQHRGSRALRKDS
eukprot:3327124-Pleurochrysis_carterae.AAC.4